MTWASRVFSPRPAVAVRITDRTQRHWGSRALLVFQSGFVSGHYRIEHFFSCRRVLILQVAVEGCEIHWGKWVRFDRGGVTISSDVLFVNITPREKVAILISGAFLRWDGVVLHDGKWDAVKRLGECGMKICEEVKAQKGKFCEMNAQKGKFVRWASRQPKLLVNTGSPGYGHVGPYLQENPPMISSDLF